MEFLQALKHKKRKETSVIKRRAKVNKINEINKPILLDPIDLSLKSPTSNLVDSKKDCSTNIETSSVSKSDSEVNSVDSIDNVSKLDSKIRGKRFRGLKVNTALILPNSFKGRLTRNQLHLDRKLIESKKSKFVYDPSKAGTKKHPSKVVDSGKNAN